jgi:hypothetical protein
MSPDRKVTDEVFTARLGLGLRELDGREAAPDVSSSVANRLATAAGDDERPRIRHWPMLAALVAVFVLAALWLQQRASRPPSEVTPAVAQDPQPSTAQQVLTYAAVPHVSGSAPSREEFLLTVVAVQQRLAGLATVSPHGTQLLVTTATGDEERVRGLVEGGTRLELRPVATADYTADGIRFDLDAERKRLQGWLDTGGRDRLRQDLGAIRDYRDAGAGLRWCVRMVAPAIDRPKHWDVRFADLPSMAAATVVAHTDADWNRGEVPPEVLALPAARRFLIELVAINIHAEFLDQGDLHAESIRRESDTELRFDASGAGGMKFALVSERWIGKHLAVLWNDEVLSAPLIASRLQSGMVHCSSPALTDRMLRMLGNPLPARLRYLGSEPAPK